MVGAAESHRRLLRWLPAGFPGKTRIGRLLLGNRARQGDVIVEARDDSRFLLPNLAEPVAFHLAVDGVYEPETLAFILNCLPEGGVFVDVGANIGVFTVPASRKVGRGGRVLAAEASPQVLPYLEKNVSLNHLQNVTLARCAISDQAADNAAFYEAPIHKFGMGSLAAQFHGAPCQVRTRTLDEVLEEHHIDRVDVLKVDVEGHEAAVFRGARTLLCAPNPPLIVFEFCDWAESRFPGARAGEAQEFVMSLGYQLRRLSELREGRGRALDHPLTAGFAMLVARRGDRRGGSATQDCSVT